MATSTRLNEAVKRQQKITVIGTFIQKTRLVKFPTGLSLTLQVALLYGKELQTTQIFLLSQSIVTLSSIYSI